MPTYFRFVLPHDRITWSFHMSLAISCFIKGLDEGEKDPSGSSIAYSFRLRKILTFRPTHLEEKIQFGKASKGNLLPLFLFSALALL